MILCDVLQGVRDESVAKDLERRPLKLEVFETTGVELAREAARNYRALCGRGHTVRKTIDCLIATYCMKIPSPWASFGWQAEAIVDLPTRSE